MSGTSMVVPEGVMLGDERLVSLTEGAGRKARALRDREVAKPYLRIRVTGGGCNGLSYKLAFVASPVKGDILVESQGIPVVLDTRSALYLRGMVMDYADQMIAGGFKFSNPNAKSSCSCGESFSV